MYESGAVNPNDLRSIELAEKMYEQIRRRKTDYINIARNTKLSLEQCNIVKNYLFYDQHELTSGYKRFTPDIIIAQSWLRLSEVKGINIKKYDVLLMYHEITEITLLLKNTNMGQREAHRISNKTYNFEAEVKLYYKQLGINI